MPILVVEDDDAIRESLVDLLQFTGHRVLAAANGAEALVLADRETPSLVLTDMWMPVMDGWEFVAALRRRGWDVPVLVMTAARDVEAAAAEVRADDFLAKPFSSDELLKRVKRLRRSKG